MSVLSDEKRVSAAAEHSVTLRTEIDKVTQEARSDVALPELESSAPPSNSSKKREEYIQFASLCFSLFLAGWNDGTTGPLLNRIKAVYHIGFTVVSLIFVVTCVGFMCGAVVNIYLNDRIGLGKVLVVGSLCQVIAYTLQCWAPPFPLFCVACWFNGIGIALQDSQANGYVASLKKNGSVKMGVIHSIYGLGALIAPLVSTQFAQIPRWSFHYLTSLGLTILNTAILALVFRGRDLKECHIAIGQLDMTPSKEEPNSEEEGLKYSQIVGNKTILILAVFSFLYMGIEVTIGGWSVTYILLRRGGASSSGYISTAFFGGLTLGRVALLWLNHKLGEKTAVFLYAILSLGLQLTIWLVDSLVENAIAISLVGLFFGPMYPILMNYSGRLLPPAILTGAIGWIAGVGTVGAALFPFITGALASRFGIQSLQPFLIVLMSLMIILWILIPRVPRPNMTSTCQ